MKGVIICALVTLTVVLGGAWIIGRYSDVMTGPKVTGTVVDTWGRGAKRYLTVETADGRRHRSRVRVWISEACPVGAPWPACREQARGLAATVSGSNE